MKMMCFTHIQYQAIMERKPRLFNDENKCNKEPRFWFKLQIPISHRNKIGSGLEEIDGNNKTELKIQMRLSFSY